MKYLVRLVILAGFLGILVWFLGFSNFSPFSKTRIISPQPFTQTQTLQIIQPADGTVLELSNLKIAGTSAASNFLAVANDADSQIFKVKEDGNFETNLALTEGFNQIKIVNFDLGGTAAEIDWAVFYLAEKFRQVIRLESTATSSGKVPELIERLTQLRTKQNLKIVAGTIKGILAKNIALETKSGSRTVVIDQNSQVGLLENFDKKLDFGAIQAQDFVVAVGAFSQQGILTAKILLVNPNKPPVFNKTANFGIATKLEKNNLELTNIQTGEKTIISAEIATIFDEQNQKVDASKIEVGNKLAVIGKFEKDKITAEKIMVIFGDFLPELTKFSTPPPSTQSATSSATQSAR